MLKDTIQKVIIKLFIAVNFLIWAYLSIKALKCSWINIDLQDENVFKQNDSIIVNLLVIIAVSILLKILFTKISVRFVVDTKKLAIILGIVASLVSVFWVINSKTAPRADQFAVCSIAEQINQGDYSEFEAGHYVACYPQQLGIITILRLIFYVFGSVNYIPFQIMSALSVAIILVCTNDLIKIISGDRIAQITGIILSFICVPIYIYTSFVYGEILSIAFMLAAFDLYIRAYRESSKTKLVLLAICSFFMVLFRMNSLIAVVAMVGIMAIKIILNDRRKAACLIIVAILLGCLIQNMMIKALYDKYFPENVETMPSIMWVAMGTNDDYGRAGWYNGLSTNLFWDNQCDSEKSKDAAEKIIEDFISKCRKELNYAVEFYDKKIESQWNAPMYQSLVMNNLFYGSQTNRLVNAVYNNDIVRSILDNYMNIYQLIIYVYVLLLLIKMWKENSDLEYYVGLVTIFGGFLFSIIWEAKTRYVFPYFVMMIPYAAWGISKVLGGKGKSKS